MGHRSDSGMPDPDQIAELRSRADAGDPKWELRDNEPVIIEWFRLLERTQDTDA